MKRQGIALFVVLLAGCSADKAAPPAGQADAGVSGETDAPMPTDGSLAGDSGGRVITDTVATAPVDGTASGSQDAAALWDGAAAGDSSVKRLSDAVAPADAAPKSDSVNGSDTGPGAGDAQAGADTKAKTPVCGDGVCNNWENVVNCYVDCKTPPPPLSQCLAAQCVAEVATCQADVGCAVALTCLDGCGPAITCYSNCGFNHSKAANDKLWKVLTCGIKDKCIDLTNNNQCGKGSCTPPAENQTNCPTDCKAPGSKCGNKVCDKPGESATNCPEDCPKPPCGDGKCQPPDEHYATCQKDCGVKPPSCGDGKCNAPQETPASCAKDCGNGGGIVNCAMTYCQAALLACNVAPKCTSAALCAASCADAACIDKCAAGLSAAEKAAWEPLRICAVKTGCL